MTKNLTWMIALLVLCQAVTQIRSLEILKREDRETHPAPTQFDLIITERGTKVVEKIEIDEEKDIEYFTVPAHNELPAAEYLNDFSNNQSVTRLRSEGVCYINPLPDQLTRPAILRSGLQSLSEGPTPSLRKSVIHHYFVLKEQVDKRSLRREVRDFCGQFPVYRREEYFLDPQANNGQLGLPGRDRRDLSDRPMCTKTFPSGCNPDYWVYRLKIRRGGCTYYVTCRLNRQQLTLCEDFEHVFNSVVCYTVSCP